MSALRQYDTNEKIELEVRLSQNVIVDVHVCDIIQSLNEMPLYKRWNTVASILNHIETEGDLEPQQREIIIKWLQQKLSKI